MTLGAPGETVARNLVPVSVWKQWRSNVEARSKTAPPPLQAAAEEEVEVEAFELLPLPPPFSPPFAPPPPPEPTGETCAEIACSECQIEAARRVSLRSSEASVGTNSCFFVCEEVEVKG